MADFISTATRGKCDAFEDDGMIDIEELLSLESLTYLYEEEGDDETPTWFYTPEMNTEEEEQSDEQEEEATNEMTTDLVVCEPINSHSLKPMLSNKQRKKMGTFLLSQSTNLNLPKGIIKQVASEYGVHRTTIFRIWKDAKRQMQVGGIINVKHKKTGNSGRKPMEVNMEQMKAIPQKQRTTIRSFASALQVSPSTIYRWIKRGIIRPHTNAIKPKLTEQHKVRRLLWILSLSIPKSMNELSRFKNLSNLVHIDEKWFYMSQVTQKYYLLADEEEPYRSCQSKKYINKVMFLGAIGYPTYGANSELLWDGKIGIFPFVEDKEAIRKSKNRDKGTIETKAIQSITKDVIRKMILTKLIPAIKAKWSANACKTIWIQQDNAIPHIEVNDSLFLEAAQSEGFDIHLICQPAQSPDLNLLDLGFFAAIQSIQYKKFPKSVDELIKSVEDAYDAYDPRMIHYTWIQLQLVMLEVLKCKGDNNYKNPHIGKAKLDKKGLLLEIIEIPDDVMSAAVEFLGEGFINVQDNEYEH